MCILERKTKAVRFSDDMSCAFKSNKNSSKRTVASKNAFQAGYLQADNLYNLYLGGSEKERRVMKRGTARRIIKKKKKMIHCH